MLRNLATQTLALALATLLFSHITNAATGSIKVYNWEDYIAEDVLERFSEATGIDVIYETFEADQDVEAKLRSDSDYDIAVPSLHFIAEQVLAHTPSFHRLDKSKLANYGNLDQATVEQLGQKDPGNSFGVPYMWGTVGIGYNEQKVRQILGSNAPVDSWALVFNPANLKKLRRCGVAFIDSPTEILPLLLHYQGQDANARSRRVYENHAEPLLKKLAPLVSYFHSYDYKEDLARGKICVAVGWSGDVLAAADLAEEEETGAEISYSIPKEGTTVWYDMLVIPRNAKNPDGAHKFIDFLLDAQVAADNTNYIWYANSNSASTALIEQDILDSEAIYPPPSVAKKLFLLSVTPPRLLKAQQRIWQEKLKR